MLNICCLLVVDVSLVPTGKWPLMALICLVMLVEVGVMGYRIARDRENDRRDDDDNGEDKRMQTGDYGRLVSFIGMYGLSATSVGEDSTG